MAMAPLCCDIEVLQIEYSIVSQTQPSGITPATEPLDAGLLELPLSISGQRDSQVSELSCQHTRRDSDPNRCLASSFPVATCACW